MTYRSRGRALTEVLLAVIFVCFLVGFVTVLCIGKYVCIVLLVCYAVFNIMFCHVPSTTKSNQQSSQQQRNRRRPSSILPIGITFACNNNKSKQRNIDTNNKRKKSKYKQNKSKLMQQGTVINKLIH